MDADTLGDALAGVSEPAELEPHLRRHQEVLDRVPNGVTVVPFRFGTLVRGVAELSALVAAGRRELEHALQRLRNKDEWAVAAYGELTEAEGEVPAPAGSGRAYLVQKQRQRSDELAREQDLRRAIGVVDAELRRFAVEATVSGVEPANNARQMRMSMAYLVDRGLTEDFLSKVAQVQERRDGPGVTVEVSGPWPPYNFSGLQVGG